MNDKAAKFKEELIDLLRKHSVGIHTKGQVDVYLDDQVWKMFIIEQDVRMEPGTRFGGMPHLKSPYCKGNCWCRR